MIKINNILDVEKYIDNMDAVIFDLDDTLYSEKDYVKSGYKKIAKYFDIEEMAEKLWIIFENGGKAVDEVLEEYGLSDKLDEALNIYRFQTPDIKPYNGIPEMINRLRKTKKVGIITDGRPEGQWAKLKALRLSVDEIIVTDELGGIEYRKPNTTAFKLMQKKLSVPFEKMVYIGDNTKKDFIAPAKLSMNSIWFYNLDGLYKNY